MTDTNGSASDLFWMLISGIYVGNEACGRLFVEALCGMARMGAP